MHKKFGEIFISGGGEVRLTDVSGCVCVVQKPLEKQGIVRSCVSAWVWTGLRDADSKGGNKVGKIK